MDSKRFKYLQRILIMLGSKDLRRCHHGGLETGAAGQEQCTKCHSGFPGTDIALNEPGHRFAFLEIGPDFFKDLSLGSGGTEWKGGPVCFTQGGIRQHRRRNIACLPCQGGIQQINQNSFKSQTSSRNGQIFQT